MIDERRRKKLLLEHSERLNAGDLDKLLELYDEEVVFEDPVGSGPQSGRGALRSHFEQSLASRLSEVPGEPVAGQDGVHALIPVSAVMDYLPKGPGFAERGWLKAPDDPAGTRLRFEYVRMIRTGSDGLIQDLKTFWGRSDVETAD
ncbi:nuclear transport factor 2 family protein [Streptomyces sp. NPDC087844]|uniref:nuclear transport factor 2 family protein n=1 Tax=Streptomyces sp. NPDC087844 TaxID=3365805 RepID=UPI003819EF14